MRKDSVRLPTHIKPERYEITLKPDLKVFKFEGKETIYLKIQKPSKEIILHAKDLKIEKAIFQNIDLKITYNDKNETVTFTSKNVIPVGKGELHISFQGILNDTMRGFYRSRYSHAGKEKYLATTQFEATDARRAFPGFDEPAQKAVFDVTLIIPKGLKAISNTIESEILEHEGGYQAVKFLPTPKMSTYLLAFIVGDFEWIEGKSKKNVLVRVFT